MRCWPPSRRSDPQMPATLDAAALTVMAARGQIVGAKVDGPLAFDNAISPDAARTKGIVSPVAGYADILLVPDLEAGNMLAKQLIYFAGATAAGLVLGARVPIVADQPRRFLTARIASAALAKLVATPTASRYDCAGMSDNLLITFNAGSSTVKIGLFEVKAMRHAHRIAKGVIDFQRQPLNLRIAKGSSTFEDNLADIAAERSQRRYG